MHKAPFWHFLLLLFIGAFAGEMLLTSLQTQFDSSKLAAHTDLMHMLRIEFVILGVVALLALHALMRFAIRRLTLTDHARTQFLKHHILTYFIFLGYGSVYWGIKANIAFAIFLFLLFIVAQLGLLWLTADHAQKDQWRHSLDAVPALFFLSGFAALIYQVVWQRVLFATFGTNIESVTVIVSVFMFGLGIGALAGGQLQKRFPDKLLECFVAIEIAIGIFGIFSIPLIHGIGKIAPPDSLIALISTTYVLLAIPTMLMGSTLPLLVGYLERRYSTLGAVVGKLYAANTLGSACASFLTVMLLFTLFGQQTTLFIAAGFNAATAYLVWSLCRNLKTIPVTVAVQAPSSPGISYRTALLFSAFIGYISLSLEILWFRILGFMTANMPQVFGVVLAIFLSGIAFGSLKAKEWSETGKDTRDFIWRSLLWMAVLAYIALPLTGAASAWLGAPAGKMMAYIAVGMLAYFSGGIFPLLCQMGISVPKGKQTGVAVSWIYFLNILGATLGSLITGFVLFDIFTLAQNAMLIWAAIIFVLCMLACKPPRYYLLTGMAVMLALALQPLLYKDLVFKLQALPKNVDSLAYLNENRHGIITVVKEKRGDIIFGNGAYDGRFNIDPVNNSNMITRAYMVAALHPHPKRILEMGLSSGSATRALSLYRPLQELISIEINPGYMDAVAHYPEIAPVLHHPKWKHYIDDGRRWLNHHPDERFDAIVMNTTYYWRNNATNLLSREFLEICKQHLNPGGIVYYNTTDARDNIFTAAHVFKYVTTYLNFVAASDTPFSVPYAQKKQNLLSFIGDNGKPIFADQKLLEKLAHDPLADVHDTILSDPSLRLITDDNMASEYKINYSFLPPR